VLQDHRFRLKVQIEAAQRTLATCLLGADDDEVAVDEHVVRPVDSDHVDLVIAAAQ
jgi:hypothetical protein